MAISTLVTGVVPAAIASVGGLFVDAVANSLQQNGNDFSDFRIMVRTSPTVAPMQVIVYMWEGHQFEGWKVFNRALIGQPKPIHLAGGYEQFRYYAINGSPSPAKDRSVRVDVRKIS